MDRLFKVPIILVLCISFFIKDGYGEEYGYERKSVAYLDDLIYLEGASKLSNSQEESYLSALHQQIKLKRFDYNPIPDYSLNEFQAKVKGRQVSAKELESLLRETVAPEIIDYVDIKKEMRAKDLVNETQRNKFIVQKARETGLTSEQLKKVMNSAYLYVSFIEDYRLNRNYEEGKLSLTIKGGLIWYHVISEPEVRVKKIARLSSNMTEIEEKEGSDSWEDMEKKAFRSAYSLLAINLKTKTRELKSFKLKAQIAEVQNRKIRFPLGSREGLKLDQPYYVGEWRLNSEGEKILKKDGFVRIGSVAKKDQPEPYLSSAWAIHKGDWARGMALIEHPRLGIDLAIKPRIIPVKINSGVFVGETENGDITAVFDKFSGNAPGIDIDMQLNIANLNNINQSFVTVGASGAVIPVKSKVFYEKSLFETQIEHFTIFEIIEQEKNINSFGSYGNGYIGYLKKYYIGPFALHWETLLGIQIFSVKASYEEDVKLNNLSLGGRVNFGLEYALTIDTNIGAFVGLNGFPAFNSWVVKKDNEEVDIDNYVDYSYPKISSCGMTYGIYFHYSLPSLSSSPL